GTTWTYPDYKLGVEGDSSGDAYKFMANHDPGRVWLNQGDSIPPGGTYTFNFRIRGPAQDGTYKPSWRMVHEGVTWFGDSASRDVRVDPAPQPGPQVRRTGRVRLSANSLEDDQGKFNALGATLFWAAWGYKFDRPRLEAALQVLSKNGFDYFRALGVVGDPNGPDYWDGREIDWRWSDYASVIAGLTDLAYDTYGLRVEWTLIGDGQKNIPRTSDRVALADLFLNISRGREQKIIHFEIANEYWQNGFSGPSGLAELRDLSRYMKDRTDILVAASAPAGGADQDVFDVYDGGVADIATIHFDRDTTKTEGPWRPVRQPWEHAYRQPRVPVGSNNEPIGPGSSVASENEPVRLVAAMIATHVSNIPMYVFHSRAGVRGDLDIANMPGVGAFAVPKGLVPGDLASWTRKNAHWADSPFRCYAIDAGGNLVPDSMWPDHGSGAQGGAVRAYGDVNGNEFFVFPLGVRNKIVMEPRRNADFDVYEPMSGNKVASYSLSAGQRFELSGAEAFVIKGQYR
ncbi:MAG: hypothetical protein HY720_27345, partial [Planctomycetes bacterium]|nr:hypothetical protein [Planctomycetota bacterium]